MKKLMQFLTAQGAIVLAGLVLSACETLESAIDTGRDFAAERVGNALIAECKLSVAARGKNLAAVNDYLATKRVPHRAVAQDCDGDGKVDELP